MELGELKAFVTVAAEHSFSRAAIKLCRTQPAVSQAIRRLEDDLAVEDFVETLRRTGEDRASRRAPVAMRALR